MEMNKKSKIPKIKITEVDMYSFTIEQLVIDPYWEDLYNPPKKVNKFGKNRKFH